MKALIISSLDLCNILLFICLLPGLTSSSTTQCFLQTAIKVMFLKCKSNYESQPILTASLAPCVSVQCSQLMPSVLKVPVLAKLWIWPIFSPLSEGTGHQYLKDRVPCGQEVCLPLFLAVCIKTISICNVENPLGKNSNSDISFQRHIKVKNHCPQKWNPCIMHEVCHDPVPTVISSFISQCFSAHPIPCVPSNSLC